MSRPKIRFYDAFKEDFPVSVMFSMFGVIGAISALKEASVIEKVLTAVVFCLISSSIFSATLAAAQTWILPRTKVPSFFLAVILTALSYLGVILVALPLIIGLFVAYVAKAAPWDPQVVRIVIGVLEPPWILIAFSLMVAITLFFMVKKKLGPGVLENWVIGRYYRPRQEQRIFMFLDLKNSTTLGEQMGDMAFSRLIQKFFEDLSDPVLKTKGEVSHYIGDEAVLTWKYERGLKDANCLKCFFLMKDAIEGNRDEYLKEFGIVPEFKAGAHLGSVVATQVGEVKSEIVFHGDVLNTTSRIQSLCNDLESEFLISRDLAGALASTDGYSLESKGRQILKGKEQDVELVQVSRG